MKWRDLIAVTQVGDDPSSYLFIQSKDNNYDNNNNSSRNSNNNSNVNNYNNNCNNSSFIIKSVIIVKTSFNLPPALSNTN